MSRVFSCCSAKLASSLIIIIMMIMIIFAFFIGEAAGVQRVADFVLGGKYPGYYPGKEVTLTCTVDVVKVNKSQSKCLVPVPTIQLERVTIGGSASVVSHASAAFPECIKTWGNKGRCVSGNWAAGEYVYEFNYTPQAEHLNDMNLYLQCSAGCTSSPAGAPYPFSMLKIRPIPKGRPTTTPGPTTLPSTAGPSSSTAAPETGLCSEAFASIGVSVVLVLLLGVATLVFLNALKKSKKAGPPAG